MNSYFPQIGKIPFEGRESRNPLAFKHYDAERVVGAKSMKDHLRFAVAYWHTFKATGADPFGAAVFARPWNASADPLERARHTLESAFEFIAKLGVPYYCFHDFDIAPEGTTFAESERNLKATVALALEQQQRTGIKLLWGTANLFSHPRYVHGAMTNPDPHVFACAAMQVKRALDATRELGGENYVFWGGREGYETILNTDMRREREQMARFLHMAVEYAKAIGFTGQFLIEPKPKEPTKHQYDFDASTVLNFLREFGLFDHFKLNIEANHATLAGHDFEHDLVVASLAGKLGSIDANMGDPRLGWDTDQFPTDIHSLIRAMLVVLAQGGLGSGGFNFDAKVRRGSLDLEDLFHGHINGMDALARALLVAHRVREDGHLARFVGGRYAGWDGELGRRIMNGRESLATLETWAVEHGEPAPRSGKQEMLESILNGYV